jgi:YbbR domain-containing protein
MKRYIDLIVKFIKKNKFVPKLASILLAVILWGYISSSKKGEIVFKSQVAFKGLEENFIVSKISHKNIAVEIRGRKDDLKNVNSRNIKLSVDLSTAEPGNFQTYRIQYQKIDLQDDFDIILDPPDVKIFVERKISRNVRIVPRFSGKTEKGFMIGRIRVNPEYVKITGPGSVINNLGVIYTDKIPVDDRNLTYRQDIKIEKVNEEVLEYNMSKVNVTVPVLANLEIASFEIPLIIKNKKKGIHYQINIDKVKIQVILPQNKKTDERSFTAYIDAGEIDFNYEEFLLKRRVEVMGFVHVNSESSEDDNSILTTSPDSVEIIVTKE